MFDIHRTTTESPLFAASSFEIRRDDESGRRVSNEFGLELGELVVDGALGAELIYLDGGSWPAPGGFEPSVRFEGA